MIWDGLASGAIYWGRSYLTPGMRPVPTRSPVRSFPLFLLFLQEIISEQDLVFGGNAGPLQVPPMTEQRELSLFPAFFRCSSRTALSKWHCRVEKLAIGRDGF
jgi:hypothetical protein